MLPYYTGEHSTTNSVVYNSDFIIKIRGLDTKMNGTQNPEIGPHKLNAR